MSVQLSLSSYRCTRAIQNIRGILKMGECQQDKTRSNMPARKNMVLAIEWLLAINIRSKHSRHVLVNKTQIKINGTKGF